MMAGTPPGGDAPRILEIGRIPYFRSVCPARTTFFDTSPFAAAAGDDAPRGLATLWRLLRQNRFDLVVCQPDHRHPLGPDALARLFGSRKAWRRWPTPGRGLAARLLRWAGTQVPVVVLDFEDHDRVARTDWGLLDAARLYFKRELPADPWRVFAGAAGRVPSPRFRGRQPFQDRVAKLRPLPLGLPLEGLPDGLDGAEKTADIFFAGTVAGLPLRERGLEELRRLEAEGVRVDIPEARLPRREYLARTARAWLTFSPQGLGWDCFRHYEAAAVGSVPVINHPPLRRHAPLEHGRTCVFYGPEPGGLAAAVREALSGKDRLARMAANAARLVRQHHTPEAICAYVLSECGLAVPSRDDPGRDA